MKFPKDHKSSFWSPNPPPKTSQFASRPFPIQAQQEPEIPPTHEQIENEAFGAQKFEATGLEITQKDGSITPSEQQRLGVLQAKMDGLLVQRRERASRFGHNFANIAVVPSDASEPVPIQAKLTIGQPRDKYEQETDSVASQVVSQINARQSQAIQREAIEEEEELQMKPQNSPIQREKMSGEEVSSSLLNGVISPTNEGLVLQRAYELTNDINHVKVTADHRAKEVFVENIKGRPLGPAANSPTVDPFGWQELWAEGHTLGNKSSTSSHYNAVRMHLWNGRLGGPGNETWNLAPGPAKVNSMMSAGPEIAAKNLVEAGYAVWLRTNVEYMNDSTNAKDFTSVVPKKIEMKWGVMGNSSLDGQWQCNIELPVEPLQGSAIQEYKNWDKNKSNELVTKLDGETEQVRAQAYDLVQHDELKFGILKAYPGTYLSMEARAKGQILQKFTDLNLLWDFLEKGLKISAAETLVVEALLPLAAVSDPIRLQFLFGKVEKSEQRQLIIRYHDELLSHLGAIGTDWSKSDYLIFNYNSPTKRANLLDAMNLDEIKTLLGATSAPERKAVFDLWAQEKGHVKPQDKYNFIETLETLSSKWKETYKEQMEAERLAIEYMSNRPTRTKKPVVVLNKPIGGGVKKYSRQRRK